MIVPIEKGKKYLVNIISETANHEGIAKIENFPIYIKNAKKGEELKIKIVDIKNYYATGVR
ncbi:TRAM domain-containing protein [Candidatus Micrarchaeota archaeon]|jgi:23S rRNA (uracil1939-C5)-methyltransferase|nr:TRAM domain-containing protein [Candidatus Micrarchaeota archaeon]